MGRHKGDHNKKRKDLLKEMVNYSTMAEWASDKGISRQAIEQLLNYYNLKDDWKKNTNKEQHEVYKLRYNISGIFCIFLSKAPSYKYYLSSIDIKNSILYHLSYLKRNMHINKELQELFNKFGFRYFKFKILKRCIKNKQLIKARYIEKDPLNLNKNRAIISIKERQREYYLKREKFLNKNSNYIKKKSRHRGLTWVWRAKRWKVQLWINKKFVYIGYFKEEKEAIDAKEEYLKQGYLKNKT